MGYLTEISRQKMVLISLLPSSKLFIFPFSAFYDLFINKVRKLEVAVLNPTKEDISLSVVVPFLLFLIHVLSLSLSLSFSVDSALQLLLCGVLSASVIFIINEL